MTTSLDKFISNDEILSYTCIIIGTITIIFLYIVMMKKIDISIYPIALFEIAFVIFIVSFLLKKKEIYDKNDDIKYDLYFYLRITLIIICIICFILYSKYLLIEDEIKINKKKGGGNDFFTKVSASFRNMKDSVASLYHKNFSNTTKYLEHLEKQINDLKIDIEYVIQIYDKLYETNPNDTNYISTKLISELKNLLAIKISKLIKIEADINKIKNKSIKKDQVQSEDFVDEIEQRKLELYSLIIDIKNSLTIKSIINTLQDEHNNLVAERNNIILNNNEYKETLKKLFNNSSKLMGMLKTTKKNDELKAHHANIKMNNENIKTTTELIKNYDKKTVDDLAIKINKLNHIFTILKEQYKSQISEHSEHSEHKLLQSEVLDLLEKQDNISMILSNPLRKNSTVRLKPITEAESTRATRATRATSSATAATATKKSTVRLKPITEATATRTRATATATRTDTDEITEA